jgi:TetR/AcrR family transcriptional repressor of lmrAB and yxaGH operons
VAARPKGDGDSTRNRILETAGRLFSEKGYQGTGLQDIVNSGKIPKGSLYFHFPDGKEQIALEAMQTAADLYRERIDKAVASAELGKNNSIHAAFTALRSYLVNSEFKMGCPVASLAQADAPLAIREQAARIYQSWEQDIQSFVAPMKLEKGQATAILAVMEGALILARTYQSLEPLVNAEQLIIQALANPATGLPEKDKV